MKKGNWKLWMVLPAVLAGLPDEHYVRQAVDLVEQSPHWREAVLLSVGHLVHCKGTDYSAETVPEAEIARELGIRTAIVGDPKDHATREIIDRLREV